MPKTVESSPQSTQQSGGVSDTESEPPEAKMIKRGPESRCIDQFKNPWLRKDVEQASIVIWRKSLICNLFPADVDEMAAAPSMNAHRLWKFDHSVPQQP